MERQTAHRVVNVITDNAPEFLSASFQNWLDSLGVDHLYSVAHEVNHNGVVERAIRTLVSMTRQLLADGALPLRLWTYALNHACFLYNRLAHSSLESLVSPFTAVYGELPRYHYLRPFGSLAFFKVLPRPAKLTYSQARLGVYLGFSRTLFGYNNILLHSEGNVRK